MSIMETNQEITEEQHNAIVDLLHFPREEGWEHGIRHFEGLTAANLDAIRAIAPGFVDDDPWNDFEGTTWLQEQLAVCGITEYTMHGYILPLSRTDRRLTVEGCYIDYAPLANILNLLGKVDTADEKSFEIDIDQKGASLFLWWD